MRVLLTGGLGYVGGRVAAHFSTLPDMEVLVSTRRTNRAAPLWLPHARLFSTSDLQADSNAWPEVDAVVHLATLNETVSNGNPEAAFEVNCLRTLRTLENAARAGCKRFFYFSTVHVCGTPLKGELSETVQPKPVQPYAIVHRAAEDFVCATGARVGIQTTILRLANAVGASADPAGQRWTLLANDLCRSAVTRRRLELRSSGMQWRNFIALGEVAKAMEHVVRLPLTGGSQIFNLAGERSYRVIEMVELIANRCRNILGFEPAIVVPQDPAPEDVSELNITITRLKETGYVPQGNVPGEIEALLQFCSTHCATN